MKALSFGEILWDVYEDKKYIGGAPLNFAAHLAKHGDEVYMLSSLGRDESGADALEQLKKWNIKTNLISVSDKKQTGCCLITLDNNSVPSYNLLDDVAYDYIECDGISDSFNVLYFGTLSLRSEYNYNSLKKLIYHNSFDEIFVDVNIRPPFYTYETVKFALENATILKISLEEMPVIMKLIGEKNGMDYKDFTKELSKSFKNISLIIVTLGAEGAFALHCNTLQEYFCSAPKTRVKSTVGAGDSFSAAFLHKYISGTDIQSSLEYAAHLAGFVVSQYDAVPNYTITQGDCSLIQIGKDEINYDI